MSKDLVVHDKTLSEARHRWKTYSGMRARLEQMMNEISDFSSLLWRKGEYQVTYSYLEDIKHRLYRGIEAMDEYPDAKK